jgi:TPP-dependent pyruvate/acetoin dehydrogenase alpha subunit
MTSLEQAEQELIALDPKPFYVPLGKWTPIIEGAFQAMSPRHWIFAGPRARIGVTLRGASANRVLDPHSGAKPYKLAPSSDHPARRALHAVGSAIATNQPTLCILGDAALAHGHFAQALDLAHQYACPIIFLLVRFPITEQAPICEQSTVQLPIFAQANSIMYASVSPDKKSIQKAITEACQSLSPILIETTLEK